MPPNRLALIAVALLVFSAFAPGSLAAQHGDAGGNQDQGDGQGSPDGQGPPADAQERRQQARDRAKQAGLFGTFTYENGQAEGDFVSFGLDEDAAEVTDFTLLRSDGNVTVFDSVAPDDFSKKGMARVTGSVLQLGGDEVRFMGFDNPVGLLKYQAQRDASVTFHLASGIDANETTNSSRIVDLEGPGNFTGSLVAAGNGTASVNDGSVTLDLQRAGVVLFRADDPNATAEERELQRGLDRAAAEDKLGSSTRVAGVNGTPVAQTNNLSVNASAREASDGRVRLEVDADRPEGKVVHLSIARPNLNVTTPDDAAVKFDGEAVPVTADLDDVVNASQGDPAAAHVVVGNETVQVTVWVPDFSLHSITTKDTTQSLPDLPEPDSAPNPTGGAGSFADAALQRAQAQADRYADIPEQARENAASRAQSAGLFGSVALEAGSLGGAFVSADVDASGGAVADVSVAHGDQRVTVAQEIEVDPFTASGSAQVTGPGVALPGQEAAITVQDTPSATVQVKAGSQGLLVNHTLPADADVDRVDRGHVVVETAEGVQVHVLVTNGNGEVVVNGDVVTVNLGANAGTVVTAEPPEDSGQAANFPDRLESLKDGHLGGEASLAAAGDQAVGADTSVSVDVSPAEAGDVSVSALVSSNVPDDRAVTLQIPKADLDVDAASEVTVTLDGEEIPEAPSLDAVLEGTVTGNAYAVTDAGDAAVQVAVNVGAFSDHTVTASGEEGDGVTDDTPVGGTLALAALAGAALGLASLRRRD